MARNKLTDPTPARLLGLGLFSLGFIERTSPMVFPDSKIIPIVLMIVGVFYFFRGKFK